MTTEPRRTSVRSDIIRLIAVLCLASVLFGLPALFGGIGPIGPIPLMFVVAFATWAVVAALAGRRRAGTVLRKAGTVVASFVGVVLFFVLELAVLGLAARYLWPRPLFCNDFVWDEKTVLPHWTQADPTGNEFGQWIQADFRDNLLVVALTRVPWRSSMRGVWGSRNEFRVQVGGQDDGKHVAIPRTSDSLVIVLPDGTHKAFPLDKGLAERFCRPRTGKTPEGNLLRETRELLDPDDREGFDAFMAHYEEPLPPRPMFHNEHGTERPPVSPYWHRCKPNVDQLDNWAWADYADNLLVIVVGIGRFGMNGPINRGEKEYAPEATFYLKDGEPWRFVNVSRTKDALIAIRSDGATVRFPLGKGLAEKFHRAHSEAGTRNLLHEARDLLPEADRGEFEKFVGAVSEAGTSRPAS